MPQRQVVRLVPIVDRNDANSHACPHVVAARHDDPLKIRIARSDSAAVVNRDRVVLDDASGERHSPSSNCGSFGPSERQNVNTPVAGPTTDRRERTHHGVWMWRNKTVAAVHRAVDRQHAEDKRAHKNKRHSTAGVSRDRIAQWGRFLVG